MVIPIGVVAQAGKQISFDIEAINLPEGLNVYLEDKHNNSLTRLDLTDSNYSVTLDDTIDGLGRFYLHTTSAALNTDDVALLGVSIFARDKNTLRVSGINSQEASIQLFDILGKSILKQSFSSSGNTDINLPNLNTGIYIVQINTDKGRISKKIVLE